MITRREAAESLAYDVGKVDPASSGGGWGVDHSPAIGITPASHGSLALHAASMPATGTPPGPLARICPHGAHVTALIALALGDDWGG